MGTITVIQLTGTTFSRLPSTDCQRPEVNGSKKKNQSNPYIAHNSSSESRLGKTTGIGSGRPVRAMMY